MHDGREINCEGRNKGLREKLKGTQAEEENKRLTGRE